MLVVCFLFSVSVLFYVILSTCGEVEKFFERYQLEGFEKFVIFRPPPPYRIVPNSFLVQTSDICDDACRQQVQTLLSANFRTNGCQIRNSDMNIGSVYVLLIACDRKDMQRPSRSRIESMSRSVTKTVSGGLTGNGSKILIIENDRRFTLQSLPHHGTHFSRGSFRTKFFGVDETDGGIPRDGLRTCAFQSNNGKGTDVWILDSGCNPSSGALCRSTVASETRETCLDTYGHGNITGRLATDSMIGIATEATRHCIKVTDGELSAWANVIIGLGIVSRNLNRSKKGNVVNLAISEELDTLFENDEFRLLNVILKELSRLGVYVVSAAGNFDRRNACDTIPAAIRAEKLFRVQAHGLDGNPWREGMGSGNTVAVSGRDCIDLSAPGVGIEVSPAMNISGTSLATAYVTGAIAVLLSDDRHVNLRTLTQRGRTINNGRELVSKRSLGLSCGQALKRSRKYQKNRLRSYAVDLFYSIFPRASLQKN